MYELGDNAASYHENLSKELSNKEYKNFFFVGNFAEDYNRGCDQKGKVFESTESLKDSIPR